MDNLHELEKKINYVFKNKGLLLESMTHSSFSNENRGYLNNERLEFLGDAVLDLCISKYIIKDRELTEGQLTKRRAQLVCEQALYTYSMKLDIPSYLLLGNGEIINGGKGRPAIMADAFEALLGAVFEDNGFDQAYETFLKIVVPYTKEFYITDYKSRLQELVQSEKKSVIYKVIEESGPPHDKVFNVAVYIEGILFGRGSGKQKNKAEQKAAKDALSKGAFYI